MEYYTKSRRKSIPAGTLADPSLKVEVNFSLHGFSGFFLFLDFFGHFPRVPREFFPK